MRRTTHLTLGAAVAMPIAVSLAPGAALGCLWWGMVGGGFPDWLDLRSDFRKPLRLRHRGASHGLPVALLATAGVALVLSLLAQWHLDLDGHSWSLPASVVLPWTISFGLGLLSHLLSDACTLSGIRPLLPFSQWNVWLLPKVLRCRHDGYLNRILTLAGLAVIAIGLVVFLRDRIPLN